MSGHKGDNEPRLLPVAEVDGHEFLVDVENRLFRDLTNPDVLIGMHSEQGRKMLRDMRGSKWNCHGVFSETSKQAEVWGWNVLKRMRNYEESETGPAMFYSRSFTIFWTKSRVWRIFWESFMIFLMLRKVLGAEEMQSVLQRVWSYCWWIMGLINKCGRMKQNDKNKFQ
jgi:hypothetical protein